MGEQQENNNSNKEPQNGKKQFNKGPKKAHEKHEGH